MAKIDRQLAQQFGESTIKVTCAPDEQIDFDLVQLQLVSELRTRSRCLSIDLRSFHGDCSTMAHVILKLQRFASGEGKVIAITNALPAMQAALSPKKRPKQTDQAKTAKDASRSADMALVDHEVSEQMIKSIDQPHENTLPVSPKKLEKKNRHKYLVLSLVTVVGAAVVIGIQAWFVFYSEQRSKPVMPTSEQIKTFE